MERAATTASSLEAEQDSGNIIRTQSTAIPNVPLPQGIGSGGRCDNRVLSRDLEAAFEYPGERYEGVESRNLEKKKKSRTYEHKRLYKVGLSARIVSSDDEASLSNQEVISKQGRKIHDIDADEDITLENVHDENVRVNDHEGDEIMFEMNLLQRCEINVDEVTCSKHKLNFAAFENAASTKVSTVCWDLRFDDYKITYAQMKKDETTMTQCDKLSYLSMSAVINDEKKTHGLRYGYDIYGSLFEDITGIKERIRDLIVERRLQKAEQIQHKKHLKRSEISRDNKDSKKQKVNDDKETKELKQCMEIILDDGDDVTIEATPLSTKSPTIVD
ncbi:hypothetical protein Tco_0727479 [Tanacetum coccineum]|uniref:Uncharacterized protein n=1 Tax=Tanacetum coccineum TaxID=301880 RepID=A0ABQ4YLH6_9ASTR